MEPDLTPLSNDELVARLLAAEAELRSLRKKQDKIGLTFKKYPEQGEAQMLIQGMIPYLTRIDSCSVVKPDPQPGEHVLIEGDNISALVALQATHRGKVDVIYIDPPYNTGNNDFVYNDRYVSNDDGFRHSKWLSFMERRLHLAKELLSETGIIFVSIDDNEQAALKILMDSVFGASNSMGVLTWFKKRKGSFLSKGIISVTEYVLAYRKHEMVTLSGGLADNSESQPLTKRTNAHKTLHFSSGSVKTKLSDGTYVAGVYGDGSSASTLLEDIVVHDGYIQSNFSLTGPFVWSQEFLDKEILDGTEIFINTKNFQPRALRHNNISHKGLPSFLDGREFAGTNEDAYEMLKNVFGKEGFFDYSKPMGFIQKLVRAATFNNPSAITLDFFAGSGTTGHAVAALNAEDGGNRQAILVTNNFEQDGSPNGIARDVTAARMKAVLTGQWADGKDHDALPGNLHYYKVDFKKPVANMVSNAQIMQTRFAGLAGLVTGSHVRVLANDLPPAAEHLRDALEEELCVLLRGAQSLVVVWQDYDELLDNEERVHQILAEATKVNSMLESPLVPVLYVPFDAEDVDEEFDFAGWNVVSFPVSYLRQVANTVEELVKSHLLLPMDEVIDDSKGEEGTEDHEVTSGTDDADNK